MLDRQATKWSNDLLHPIKKYILFIENKIGELYIVLRRTCVYSHPLNLCLNKRDKSFLYNILLLLPVTYEIFFKGLIRTIFWNSIFIFFNSINYRILVNCNWVLLSENFIIPFKFCNDSFCEIIIVSITSYTFLSISYTKLTSCFNSFR